MEINVGKIPFDLDFHPSNSLVSTCLINGDIKLFMYGNDSVPQKVWCVHGHDESCRAVRFIDSGKRVVTGSSDCSILAIDVETGRISSRLENAHSSAISRLLTLTEHQFASGDDDGCIKVWDARQHVCCNSFNAHVEYISDMCYASASMQLLGTSGDGRLSMCNLRRNKVQAQTEFCDDEFLSVVIMKNGEKVVCGTQTGNIFLYSWGHLEESKNFRALYVSVDALLKLDENTLISGSEDGIIRLVGILPNRIIQPLAEHSEYPVERLSFSYDRKIFGSISHDQMLKLWNLEDMLTEQLKIPHKEAGAYNVDDGMDDSSSPHERTKGMKRKTLATALSSKPSTNFFADLE